MGRAIALICIVLFSLVSSGGDIYGQKAGEETVRFKTYKYIDREGIGIEAFRLLIPADWQFDGGLRWRLDNPGIPVEASFRVRNPQGAEEFQAFPNLPFFWTNNQMMYSIYFNIFSRMTFVIM